MHRYIVLSVAAILLAACETVDKSAMSYFTPTGPDTFVMSVKSADGPYMEGRHRGWIDSYVKDNSYCPNGYTITDTKRIKVGTTMFGEIYQFSYFGTCNPGA